MSAEKEDMEEYQESESEKRYNKSPDAKSIKGFIDALYILAPYMKLGVDTKYSFGAEHDSLYVYTEDGKPEEESPEGLRLSELGFHWNEESEGWAYYT